MTVEITDANIKDVIASGKPVVIDIWAVWCGPCRMLGKIVDKFEEEYDGRITIGKLDAGDEKNENLCADLGVINIPTLLFYNNGELVHRHVGYLAENELRQLFDSIL